VHFIMPFDFDGITNLNARSRRHDINFWVRHGHLEDLVRGHSSQKVFLTSSFFPLSLLLSKQLFAIGIVVLLKLTSSRFCISGYCDFWLPELSMLTLCTVCSSTMSHNIACICICQTSQWNRHTRTHLHMWEFPKIRYFILKKEV